MKTVRFAQVVARSGRPSVHTLWVAPEKDAELTRAAKAQRVMTVRSPRGKTDTGEVGFNPKASAGGEPFQLLIFPKTLAPFSGARVVGIKFDLVEQPKPVAASASPPSRRAARRNRRGQESGAPGRPGKERRLKTPPPTRPKAEDDAEGKPRLARARHPPAALRRAEDGLRLAVRTALKELENGKSVAAYRRLQRALENEA